MKKQAKVLKFGFMVALCMCMSIVPFAMVNNAISAEAEEIERIPFVLPTLKADKMPPVFFSHEKHIEAVEAAGKDCTACHTVSDTFFLDSEEKSADTVVAYVHDSCVSCHANVASGSPTGPLLASCRSCHDSGIAAKQEAAAAQ